jgi:hypothetical protein
MAQPWQSGSTPYFVSGQKATKLQIKSGSAFLFGWHIQNLDASVTYLQFFDAPASGVTVGTTTPSFVIAVPASGLHDADDSVPIGLKGGLTIAATTTATGSGAPTNGLNVNLFYF